MGTSEEAMSDNPSPSPGRPNELGARPREAKESVGRLSAPGEQTMFLFEAHSRRDIHTRLVGGEG
jgi:hypothetical protein